MPKGRALRASTTLPWLVSLLLITPTTCLSTTRAHGALAPADPRDSSSRLELFAVAERRDAILSSRSSEASASQQQQQQQQLWQNATDVAEAVPFLAVRLDAAGLGTSIEYAECHNRMSAFPGECARGGGGHSHPHTRPPSRLARWTDGERRGNRPQSWCCSACAPPSRSSTQLAYGIAAPSLAASIGRWSRE